jgi:hypothetical protein
MGGKDWPFYTKRTLEMQKFMKGELLLYPGYKRNTPSIWVNIDKFENELDVKWQNGAILNFFRPSDGMVFLWDNVFILRRCSLRFIDVNVISTIYFGELQKNMYAFTPTKTYLPLVTWRRVNNCEYRWAIWMLNISFSIILKVWKCSLLDGE